MAPVDFGTEPAQYRHLRMEIDGEIARILLQTDEHGGIAPGYELKLNSYDLGVDIELHDAVQRLRFSHPEVRAVVLTSGLDKVFCAGANIRMLAQADHAWKVNFCKFTNETRNEIEDAGADSGQAYLAAVNGNAAGGGYELALACDEIIMVDDGSAAVSLPEVPLLAVLPGTGGLTRLVDKRKVRKDLADVVATRSEGVRAKTALEWGLVDAIAPPSKFADTVRTRAQAAAARSGRAPGGPGITLAPRDRSVEENKITYPHVTAGLDRAAGLGQHPDVRPGAEHLVQAAGEHDRADLRAGEPQSLDRVVQLDVHAEVVGVQLQLVAGGDAALLVGLDHDARDLAVDLQAQVPVAAGLGVEVNGCHHAPVCLQARTAPARVAGLPQVSTLLRCCVKAL